MRCLAQFLCWRKKCHALMLNASLLSLRPSVLSNVLDAKAPHHRFSICVFALLETVVSLTVPYHWGVWSLNEQKWYISPFLGESWMFSCSVFNMHGWTSGIISNCSKHLILCNVSSDVYKFMLDHWAQNNDRAGAKKSSRVILLWSVHNNNIIHINKISTK